MNWRICLVAITISASGAAEAFEVSGISSGMSREEVRETLINRRFEVDQTGDDQMMASRENRIYILDFCRNELAMVNSYHDSQFQTLVKLISHFEDAYGNPESVTAQLPEPTKELQYYWLAVSWKTATDIIEVSRSTSGTRRQVLVTYTSRNECFGDNFFE